MQLQHDYFAAYRSLKLTRDADGILVAEFHTKGGPFRFTAQAIYSCRSSPLSRDEPMCTQNMRCWPTWNRFPEKAVVEKLCLPLTASM
jgi:hypothetical protein